jgi:hypothetical protein
MSLLFIDRPGGCLLLYHRTLILLLQIPIALYRQQPEPCIAVRPHRSKRLLDCRNRVSEPQPASTFIDINEVAPSISALFQIHEVSIAVGVVPFIIVLVGIYVEVGGSEGVIWGGEKGFEGGEVGGALLAVVG